MHGEDFFRQAFIYLLAAVVAVPIAKRTGLGSVLGYLLAGIAIGPFALGLIGEEGRDVMHFAEFGVVMMLFLVGLELEPAILWRLRVPIVGLGGLQVLGTALLLGAGAMLLGLDTKEAIAVGLTLSMSSTAIALQSLGEKGLLKTNAGQSSFAVLLFQDIAVIPMLAIFPLLAVHPAVVGEGGHGHTWVDGLPAWAQTLFVLGAVAGIVIGGQLLVRPMFLVVARTRLRELFVATALFLVISIALLMTKVGLSPALGTFIAGVVLAGSEYRHELESDIEPFKGLLLGLFFIAVGVSIDFGVVASQPGVVAGLVGLVFLVKLGVLVGLGRAFGLALDQRLIFAFSLWQVGEFAFVLLSFSTQNGVVASPTAALLNAVVAISMALTPILGLLCERVLLPRIGTRTRPARVPDEVDEDNAVLIAGYGRVGQIVGRILRANGVGVTVLEHDSDQVEMLRKFGHKVYYGDATRADLLEAAGAHKAKLVVVAIDDAEKRLAMVHMLRKHFPKVQILARSTGRTDAYDLVNAGVEGVYRETFGTSARIAADALQRLGRRAYAAQRATRVFERHDERNMRDLAALYANKEAEGDWLKIARARTAEVEKVMAADLADKALHLDDAWDSDELRRDVLAGTFVVPRPDAGEG